MVQSFGRHIEIKNYRLKPPCPQNLCTLGALCGEKNNLCGEKFAWEEVYQKKINFEVVKGCSVDEHICRIQDITGNKSNNLDNNFV